MIDLNGRVIEITGRGTVFTAKVELFQHYRDVPTNRRTIGEVLIEVSEAVALDYFASPDEYILNFVSDRD